MWTHVTYVGVSVKNVYFPFSATSDTPKRSVRPLQSARQGIDQTKFKQKDTNENVPEVGMIAGVTIGIIITVSVSATILGVFLYVLYSRRAETRTRTMVFDNNSLIKTNEDLYALTRSSSSMIHSRSSSMLKHVPTVSIFSYFRDSQRLRRLACRFAKKSPMCIQ